jgi:hypothetical protein
MSLYTTHRLRGGGAAHKKRGGPLPPDRYFWRRGYPPPLPVAGNSCGYRRKSTGNGGWICGAMEGYPLPLSHKGGVPLRSVRLRGVPPALIKRGGTTPLRLRVGPTPQPLFLAKDNEQEFIVNIDYESSLHENENTLVHNK